MMDVDRHQDLVQLDDLLMISGVADTEGCLRNDAGCPTELVELQRDLLLDDDEFCSAPS